MRAGVRAVTYLAFGSLVLAGICTTAGASTALSPPIKVHVSLDRHRAVAGQSIKGSVVLTNTTAKDITVETCARNGWLTVGLSGRVNAYSFVHTTIGCLPTTRIVPGPNRFGVTVDTTFTSCTQPQPAGNPPTPTSPTCTVSGLPPLPGGRYSTTVDVVGLTGLTQRPNRVVVELDSPKHPSPLAPCADQPNATPRSVTVPNVLGESELIAALVIAKACLNAVYASPVGTRVISESPMPGSMVSEHSKVTLGTR